jgi:hypothetical protein
LALSDWAIPIRVDPEWAPLDLKGITRPRSILTDSVSDLLLTVRSRSYGRNKEGEELTEEKGRRRGPAALEINGEVSLMVLCINGVHDGLQRITASSKMWSTIFRAPCNSDEGWLELDVLADVLWA